jgi:hypothetical protein
MFNFVVTLCYTLLQPRKAFSPKAGYIEDRLVIDDNRIQRRDVMKMHMHMVMDTICACFVLKLMLTIFLALANNSTTMQLVSTLPRELLYVAAFPFVF